MEEKISSHDTGDGAARSDSRDIGAPICDEVDQTSCHTAQKVEGEISNMAEPVFDVISEDIEKPHIHDYMKESSVEEHGSQKREILLEPGKVGRESWIGVSEGYDSIEIEGIFQIGALSELPEKGKHIENNDDDINDRKGLRSKSVSNGNHTITPFNIIPLFFKDKGN
jgi:hypothetical protein